MARRKPPIKSLSDAMKAPGPKIGSEMKYVQTTVAGAPNVYLAVYDTGARVFQFKKSRNGVRYSITIGALGDITMVEAIEMAREYREMVMNGIDPRLSVSSNCNMTLEKFISDQYIPYIKENFKSYRNMLNMINKRILPALGSMLLKQISKKAMRTFLNGIKDEVNEKTGRKISGATINRYHAFASGLFKYAMEQDLIETNPCVGIRRVKENKSRDRHLGSHEYPKIMREIMGMVHCPQGQVILLLAVLGLRPGEVMGLLWSDVHLSDRRLYIRDPKNGESRFVPLNTVAFDLLSTMFESRDKSLKWVFPSNSATGHLLNVRKTFATICKKSGVLDFQLRDLRRSHATLLLQTGEVDLLTIKSVLGHKSWASTMVYARVGNAAMAEANEFAASRFTEATNA